MPAVSRSGASTIPKFAPKSRFVKPAGSIPRATFSTPSKKSFKPTKAVVPEGNAGLMEPCPFCGTKVSVFEFIDHYTQCEQEGQFGEIEYIAEALEMEGEGVEEHYVRRTSIWGELVGKSFSLGGAAEKRKYERPVFIIARVGDRIVKIDNAVSYMFDTNRFLKKTFVAATLTVDGILKTSDDEQHELFVVVHIDPGYELGSQGSGRLMTVDEVLSVLSKIDSSKADSKRVQDCVKDALLLFKA